jgi:hypothetical protein
MYYKFEVQKRVYEALVSQGTSQPSHNRNVVEMQCLRVKGQIIW